MVDNLDFEKIINVLKAVPKQPMVEIWISDKFLDNILRLDNQKIDRYPDKEVTLFLIKKSYYNEVVLKDAIKSAFHLPYGIPVIDIDNTKE